MTLKKDSAIDSLKAGEELQVEKSAVSRIESNSDVILEKQEVFGRPYEEKSQEPKNKKHKKYKKQCTNVCHVCAKSMKGQTRIDRHIFYDHNNSPKSDHQCETCTAYFFNQADLMSHNKGRK